MRLIYVYHSCYVLEFDDFSVVVDYYKDSGESPLKGYVHDVLLCGDKRLYVLSSHFHPDHFNPDVLQWKLIRRDVTYVLSDDILLHHKAEQGDGFFLTKGEVFEDDKLSIRAFGSTDAGISFLIKAAGQLIFHAGDLNNWHWMDESTPQESQEAEAYYLRELADLTREVQQIDLALFPLDPRLGEHYLRGAQQFVDALEVNTMAPMHFGEAYAKAAAFSEYARAHGCRLLEVSAKGQSFDL